MKARTIVLRREHPIDAAKRLANEVTQRAVEIADENAKLTAQAKRTTEWATDLSLCLADVLRMVKRTGGFMSATDQEVCRVARLVLHGQTIAQLAAEVA